MEGKKKTLSVLWSVLAVLAILVLGMGVRYGLAKLRKEPKQVEVPEAHLDVTVMTAHAKDVPVVIEERGQVRPLNTVQITPEVAGNVVAIHPRLEVGEVIEKGALLFRIDPRNYTAAQAQAQAQVMQSKSALERIRKQSKIDEQRLGTLRRSRELTHDEYKRVARLFEEEQVGAQSGVDAAEMSFNQANDAYDVLAQAIALYPTRIQEAQSALAAAEAQVALATANMDRTEVYTPFTARIKTVQVEEGQYVAPGAPVLTLADDSILEIAVGVDSRDARKWLQFDKDAPASADEAWFSSLAQTPCKVRWTESPESQYWEGSLHRVISFDDRTRTLTLAVRLTAEQAQRGAGEMPLVDGMFCSVEIPGRTMKQVYELPRWLVTFEGEVYVAEEGRLARRTVQVVRKQGDYVYVAEGLKDGEQIITTRLVNPLPNSLLRIQQEEPLTEEHAAEASQ